MKSYMVKIDVVVDSEDSAKELADFYKDNLSDYEGARHKTHAIIVNVTPIKDQETGHYLNDEKPATSVYCG